MARTIGQILGVQLLGHRRTCHIAPTDPTVHLNPVGRMTAQLVGLRRPLSPSAPSLRSPSGSQAARPGGASTAGGGAGGMMDRIVVAVAIGMGLVFGTGIMVG